MGKRLLAPGKRVYWYDQHALIFLGDDGFWYPALQAVEKRGISDECQLLYYGETVCRKPDLFVARRMVDKVIDRVVHGGFHVNIRPSTTVHHLSTQCVEELRALRQQHEKEMIVEGMARG